MTMLFSKLLKTVGGCDIPGEGCCIVMHEVVKGRVANLLTQCLEEEETPPIDDGAVAFACVGRNRLTDGDFLVIEIIPSALYCG